MHGQQTLKKIGFMSTEKKCSVHFEDLLYFLVGNPPCVLMAWSVQVQDMAIHRR